MRIASQGSIGTSFIGRFLELHQVQRRVARKSHEWSRVQKLIGAAILTSAVPTL